MMALEGLISQTQAQAQAQTQTQTRQTRQTWMKSSNCFMPQSEMKVGRYKSISREPKRMNLNVSCSYRSNKYPGSVRKSGSFPATLDESLILKEKSKGIAQHLNGRCVYLVGMMGSGKTTVGKILAGVLGYSFLDSDTLVENVVGGTSIAEIFKLHGEGFFRDNETEVLQKLSSTQELVIATGGGAVVRPINWKYMRGGVSVWLDVPLEALVRRITAVGTNSRPLLHQASGDLYSKTFMRLSNILEERGKAYANANVRLCLDSIATKFYYQDVCNLSPTAITIEALEQIGNFLKEDGSAM